MKVKEVRKNVYRRVNWFREHEMISYTLLALVFWAVVVTAFIF